MNQNPIPNRFNNVRYPYLYAESVVDAFIEKYARVTIFVAKKSGYTVREFRYRLIKLFMDNNVRWNTLREVLKYVDKHQLYDEIAFLSKRDFQKYLTAIKALSHDSFMDNGNLRITY